MPDETPNRRLGVAIATAAATTTLAVGVTAASLLGLLGPARTGEAPAAPSAPASSSAEPTRAPAPDTAAPPVILVPVAPATEPLPAVEAPPSTDPGFEGDHGEGERLAFRHDDEDDEHEHEHEGHEDD